MLTRRQIDLARHALGLPNRRRQSYRNYFTAGGRHPDYSDWMEMVAAGYARSMTESKLVAGDTIFYLTAAGALAAINNGETLDPRDFKESRKRSAVGDRPAAPAGSE